MAFPDGDVDEELGSRADDMATDSPFWNTVQRGAAALLPPYSLGRSTLRRHCPGSHNDSSHGPHFRVSSRGLSLVCDEDTVGFKTRVAIIIEPGDITSSCGLRVLVSRGGITFTAA